MSRTQWTLTGLLLIQGLLLLLVAAPWSSGGTAQANRVLLPEFESSAPVRIEILEGEDSLRLRREDDAWQIEQADGFPADPAKVDELLSELEQIEVRRPVVSGSRYHEALKVTADDNERRLRIWDSADGEPSVELLIGTSPNYGVQHVRRSDDDRVYEVRGLSPWNLRAETGSWVDADLLDVVATDITAIKLNNGHGSFELARSDDSGWRRVDGEFAVDSSRVEQFLQSIEGLTLSEPAGRIAAGESFGLDDPAVRLELVREPMAGVAETVALSIGDVTDEESGKRYARVDGSQFVVVLSKWDADRLVDQAFDDLSPVEVEPAP